MQLVLDYLKQNQQRFLLEFCDYLRFPSVSAQPAHKKDLHACAEWLVAHCRDPTGVGGILSTLGENHAFHHLPDQNLSLLR